MKFLKVSPIFRSLHLTRGQSIMELIVAMAIGVILVVGAVSAISPILKISGDVARIQTGAALGKELLENARVLAEANWHAMDSLATRILGVWRYVSRIVRRG